VQEPPALFALRDEEDEELIDDSNMARKIEAGRNFKLCSSPTIEAAEMVDKLSSRDEKALKMATYTLQRLIRDKPFYDEFIHRGGVEELVAIALHLDGSNTLAYALTCIQNLIECCNEKWEVFDARFTQKVVNVLVHQERINVCRPATAILKKLVTAGSDSDTSKGSRSATPSSTPRLGFEIVYGEIQKEPNFLPTLMQRLGSADTTLCLYSLSLINSLMRHVSDSLFDAFTSELERLAISRAVTRLMDSNRGDELVSSILEYQMNVIRVAHHRLNTAVTPTDKRHVSALSYIWLQARVSEATVATEDGSSQKYKWRRLGFETEMVAKEFSRTGWLGLECCEAFVRADPDQYAKIILEQINRPTSRRCPWAKASLEVVEILSDHYDIQSGYSTSTRFQPCLLAFTRLHSLAVRFFIRMWSESGAATSDFGRVSALVRSQVKEALRDEASRSWFDVESDFLESDYRVVRDRQMRELETEDDFTSKASIRNLRGRLYRESYEFVRQQRIQCLLEGAWFRNPSGNTASTVQSRSAKMPPSVVQSSSKPWRFYRLSPNRKYLYYCEAAERRTIRSGLDDLPERIDLNLVTEVSVHSASQPITDESGLQTMGAFGSSHSNGNGYSMDANSTSLTFSLLRSSESSLAELVALNQSQLSEWTDGLSMLQSTGGLVSTKETADYIQILTDIGVKVKLLDLTGEAVDVPSSLELAPVPSSMDFFFAEL
jgi:engulfment/cell motility protein 1